MLQEASLVKHLKKQYVQCTACEHFCAIEPGGMGKCGSYASIISADPANFKACTRRVSVTRETDARIIK